MKKFLKKIWRIYLRLLPKTQWGDYFHAVVLFVISHRRLPNRNYFNDNLFKLRTSREVLNPLRQFTSDKEYGKVFIKAVIGDEYNVPTRAVLKNSAEIDAFAFKKGDVVKPTHASGQVVFVDDPEKVDRALIKSWLKLDYYAKGREANYKYLQLKIIVEPAIFGKTDIDDIKFYCVDGKVGVIFWAFDRHTNYTGKFYDRHWKDLNASSGGYPVSTKEQAKPHNLEAMLDIAEKLASHFNSFIRVDMYWNEETGQFLVGELSNIDSNGCARFNTPEAEERVSRILFPDDA